MTPDEEEAILSRRWLGRVTVFLSHLIKRHVVKLVVASFCLNLLVEWHFGTLLREERAERALSCTSLLARRQTVASFWTDTSTYRQNHSAHELSASKMWTQIVADLTADKVGSPSLRRDVGNVANLWVLLAADDSGDSKRAKQYLADLQRDYDTTCKAPEVVPSP